VIKTTSPTDWGHVEKAATPIKFASTGLRGADRAAFVKQAGYIFLPQLERIQALLQPGEVPAHVISVSTTEKWGPNRNGDGFKEAVCRDRHDTFVKHARAYRDHINKDPALSYGRVLTSAFNPEMGRIDLCVAYNGTKEAAERNGGLLADIELEKLASSNHLLSASMACRIAHDICSCCFNKAANRSEYCDESTCEAGGCKDNLGRMVKLAGRLHHLHVDNPSPLTWFDITCVTNDRQADRVALGVAADWAKTACDLAPVIGGAERAELLGVDEPWSEEALGVQKLASGLAAMPFEPAMLATQKVRPAVCVDRDDPLLAEKLAALADIGVFLTPAEFAPLVQREVRPTAAAYSHVAGTDIRPYLNNNPLAPLGISPGKEAIQFARSKTASACTPAVLTKSAAQAVIRRVDTTPAVGGDGDVTAAVAYALYKSASLWRYLVQAGDDVKAAREFGLTARGAKAQDWLK